MDHDLAPYSKSIYINLHMLTHALHLHGHIILKVNKVHLEQTVQINRLSGFTAFICSKGCFCLIWL